MTPSQITRTINWIAMPVALAVLVLVSYHIYQRHFVQAQSGIQYQFDDLPMLDTAPLTADINGVIQKHIFGTKPKASKPNLKPVVKKAVPKPAPKTRLNIKLTGVIDGTSPETGMALMEVERGRTLVVAVGEKIGDTDAVLHQVLPGEVLIDRDGTIESVKMIRKTLSIASLDPSLSSNLPQPYMPGGAQTPGRETYDSSSNPGTLPVSRSSRAFSQAGDRSESARSGSINRFPGRRGFPRSDDDDEELSGRLPVPRALRN